MIRRVPASYAFIGEIIRAVDCDPEISSGRDARWWDGAQSAFGNRLDYLVWRQHWRAGSDFAGVALDWSEIAARFADEENHTNAWGMLVLAPSLIKRANGDAPSEGGLLARAVLRKSARLERLESALVGCAIARFLAEAAAYAALEVDEERSVDRISAKIRRIWDGLRSINPGWHPHVHPDMREMADEPMLLPMSAAGALGHIYAVLRDVVLSGREVVRKESKLTSAVRMHHRLALTAITAWRCQCIRWRLSSKMARATYGDFIAADGWKAPEHRHAQEEFRSLLRIAYEYFNGADLFKAANFAHLAFRVVPEPDDFSWREADFWSRWIHQIGLEIDDRFRKEMKWEPDSERLGTHLSKEAGEENTFWQWVRTHQETKPDWRLVIETCSRWRHLVPQLVQGWSSPDVPTDELPLRLLTFLAHRVENIDCPDLRAALFRLCLNYSMTSLAATIVVTLPATDRDSTMQFSRAILRMQTAMPIGFDEDQHEKFRQAVRARFASHASTGQEFTAEDAFTMHELLLGRSLVHLRSMPQMVSSNHAAQFHGMITDAEVRRLLVAGGLSRKRGVGIVESWTFEKFAADYCRQVGGEVFFLTIVRLGEGCLSVFGSNGRVWKHTFLTISRFGARLKALRETLPIATHSPHFNVPWGQDFTDFARSLVKFAGRCAAAQARVVIVAVEPELAGIPWQDLFRRGAGDNGKYWSDPAFLDRVNG